MKDGVKSTIVITLICLVVSGLLGLTNIFTAPLIEKGAKERAEATCSQILPSDDGFEELDLDSFSPSLPESISALYREKGGKGYVFQMTVRGYENGLVIMCAIDTSGKLIDVKTLSSSETKTIGGKTEKAEYTDQYKGLAYPFDKSKVDGVSGATITSTAYVNAVADAFTAYELVSKTKN